MLASSGLASKELGLDCVTCLHYIFLKMGIVVMCNTSSEQSAGNPPSGLDQSESGPGFIAWFFGGWLLGTCMYSCCVVLFFGSAFIVAQDEGKLIEKEVSVLERLGYGPLYGLPWGIYFGLAGRLATFLCGKIGACAFMGAAISGTFVALAYHDADGWLVLLVPVYVLFFSSALILLLALFVAIKYLRGWKGMKRRRIGNNMD